jgi:hypothetical protein
MILRIKVVHILHALAKMSSLSDKLYDLHGTDLFHLQFLTPATAKCNRKTFWKRRPPGTMTVADDLTSTLMLDPDTRQTRCPYPYYHEILMVPFFNLKEWELCPGNVYFDCPPRRQCSSVFVNRSAMPDHLFFLGSLDEQAKSSFAYHGWQQTQKLSTQEGGSSFETCQATS